MQKIQSYLYPNRVILIADLAGFNVENTIVYQRATKIYRGVDNVLEFDIQNADQKRLDLITSPTLTNIQLNVMDAGGKALPNSPYAVSPLGNTVASATLASVTATIGQATTTTITISNSDITGTFASGNHLTLTPIKGVVTITSVGNDIDTNSTILTVSFNLQTVAAATGVVLTSTSTPLKGIGSVTIPSADLAELTDQFLKFSVTASKGSNTIPLYCDARFGAVGAIELVGDAMPITRPARVYTDFYGEINFMGNVINHSSAAPTKFYEAVPVTTLSISVELVGYIGDIYVEGTNDMDISVESFLDSEIPNTRHTFTTAYTGTYTFPTITIGSYNYVRVSWLYPDVWQFGGQQATNFFGSITKVTISS